MFNSTLSFRSFKNPHSTNVKSLHFFPCCVLGPVQRGTFLYRANTSTALYPQKEGGYHAFGIIPHSSTLSTFVFLASKHTCSGGEAPPALRLASSYSRPHRTNGIWLWYVWLAQDFLATNLAPNSKAYQSRTLDSL